MYQRISKIALMIVLIFSMLNCKSETQEKREDVKQIKPLNVQQLDQVLKIKGATQNGDYKISIPQNDLNIIVDGFKIIPPMGATSWIAFTPASDGAQIMGDIVLKETEVGPVEKVLFDQGLYVTALHKHFEGESPRVMFMHIGSSGSQETLAKSVRSVLDEIEALRGDDPSKALSVSVTNTLNTEALANIIGYKGSTTNGVFKISIGRPDIDVDMYSEGENEEIGKEQEGYENREGEKGERNESFEKNKEGEGNEKSEGGEEQKGQEAGRVHATAFTGFNTWIAFQGTPGKAAVTGDFAMLADEVPAVTKTLVENGFKVLSLHNHMIAEEPRIFFLHYWGTGNAQEMARGLRKALDQTKKTEHEKNKEDKE